MVAHSEGEEYEDRAMKMSPLFRPMFLVGAGESVEAGVPASFEMTREAQPASASARSAAGTRLGIVSLISPSRLRSHLALTIVMAMTAPVSS